MSDLMLHGVLNMPPEIWGDSELDKIQRHARYVEASERIRKLEEIIFNITESRHDKFLLNFACKDALQFIGSTK
jgi:hypothetical protein